MEALPVSDIGASCLDKDNQVSTEICYAFMLDVMPTYVSLAQENGSPMPF